MSEPVLDWTAGIPDGWAIVPLKRVAEIANSNVDKKCYEDGIPVRLCNYTDVYYNEYITPELSFMDATATASEIRRFRLRPGDVIITKDSESWDDIAIPACVREDISDLVCGYHLTVLRPRAQLLDGRFLLRALQATGVREQFWVSANGVTRFGIGLDGIGMTRVPHPPLARQRAIADFLDRRTVAIDALIEKKERLIALLQEKRQALISQAVTKGLDPNVPMKHSGIEWLRQIPAHWGTIAVKRTARLGYKTFTDGDWIESPYITEEGVRLLQTGNVGIGDYREKGFRYVSEETFHALRCTEVEPGDVLVCRLDGPVGRACLAPDLGVKMITSVDNAIIKVAEDFDPRFIVYFMSSGSWLNWIASLCRVGGGFRLRISRSMLGELKITAPPRAEQTEIADLLDSETGWSLEMESKLTASIDRLREYRQAVVTAAVTGKLDVASEAA